MNTQRSVEFVFPTDSMAPSGAAVASTRHALPRVGGAVPSLLRAGAASGERPVHGKKPLSPSELHHVDQALRRWVRLQDSLATRN